MSTVLPGYASCRAGLRGAEVWLRRYIRSQHARSWKQSDKVKESVSRYSEEFVDCLGEIAQYIYDTYGKFPGTIPTIVLTGFVQAQHIDTEYYDTYFPAGTYLETHANHMQRWHA